MKPWKALLIFGLSQPIILAATMIFGTFMEAIGVWPDFRLYRFTDGFLSGALFMYLYEAVTKGDGHG